jgi:hypothetical protein
MQNIQIILNATTTLVGKLFLNPIVFLFYVVFMSKNGFIYSGTNTSFINYKKFLPFSLSFFILTISLSFFLFYFVRPTNNVLYQFVKYQIEFKWPQLIAWLLTLFILNIYRSGMEGNIMGFFGFPIILLSCCLQVFTSWSWINEFIWSPISNLTQPLVYDLSQYSFASVFIACLILNPIFTFLFQHLSAGNEQKNVEGGVLLSFLSSMITFGIIYLSGLLCLWMINYFLTKTGNFGDFIKIYSLQFNTFKIVSFAISFISILIITFLYFLRKMNGPLVKSMIFINFIFYSIAEFKNIMKVLNKK